MEDGGRRDACDMDIFILFVCLFVLVCAGCGGETLYPREIALSTGAF